MQKAQGRRDSFRGLFLREIERFFLFLIPLVFFALIYKIM